jgi:hypothetical protein
MFRQWLLRQKARKTVDARRKDPALGFRFGKSHGFMLAFILGMVVTLNVPKEYPGLFEASFLASGACLILARWFQASHWQDKSRAYADPARQQDIRTEVDRLDIEKTAQDLNQDLPRAQEPVRTRRL